MFNFLNHFDPPFAVDQYDDIYKKLPGFRKSNLIIHTTILLGEFKIRSTLWDRAKLDLDSNRTQTSPI